MLNQKKKEKRAMPILGIITLNVKNRIRISDAIPESMSPVNL
jgi:hypothetical protein